MWVLSAMNEYDFHPFSKLFPLIMGDEFEAFKADIQSRGQSCPIVLYEGKILDGRNRYRSCIELGIEPAYEQYSGDDALSHVLSLNLYRRQLSVAQRALIAAEFSSLRNDTVTTTADAPAIEQLALEEASKLMAVSPRSISSACKVVREGAGELLESVKQGAVSISAAELVCKLSLEEQRELCEKGAKAIARAAREIREESKPAKKTPKPQEETPATPIHPKEASVIQTIAVTTTQSQGKNSTERMLTLAQEAMEEGYEPATLVGMLMDEVEDGLDMQLLLFTAEAMALLAPQLKLRALRKI